MILKSLQIYRKDDWTQNCKGPLIGKIAFKNDRGTIELELSEDMAKRLLAIVADGVVETAQEVATQLTADVINGASALIAAESAA